MLGHHAISEAPISGTADSISRSITDAPVLKDAITASLLLRPNRTLSDATQFSDRISTTLQIADIIIANSRKTGVRPRWLFSADIGGTKRYSSEDLEKP